MTDSIDRQRVQFLANAVVLRGARERGALRPPNVGVRRGGAGGLPNLILQGG